MEIEKWVTLVVGMGCLTACYTVYITQTKADGVAFGSICAILSSLATYVYTQKIQASTKNNEDKEMTDKEN